MVKIENLPQPSLFFPKTGLKFKKNVLEYVILIDINIGKQRDI